MVANGGGKKLSTPFPAIVGQADLKRALLAVAVDDGLSGALLVGEKGTAKSTAVRGLVDLLPDQRAVADCPYGCPPDDPRAQCSDCRSRDSAALPVDTRPTPLVTLPLGATRERVVGSLSVADALAGEAEFDPGLLARANRGFLYVDEVNLLGDHLVDVLLSAAASGVNRVERDGVSVTHPARFTLIGTMNPEEGDLRPQLRDRFDLRATVTGATDLEDRVEIVARALDLEDHPDPRAEYADELERLRERLHRARERLPSVDLPRERRTDIAALCLEAGVDGHRGDIATARTARTLAALDGRVRVSERDVREAARFALGHRLRSTPFEEPPDLESILDDALESDDGAADGTPREEESGTDAGVDRDAAEAEGENGETGSNGNGPSETSHGPESEEGDDGGTDADARATGACGSSAEAAGGADVTDGSADPDRGDGAGDDSDPDGGANDPADAEPATPLVPGQRRAEIGDGRTPPEPTPEAVPDSRVGGRAARGRPRVEDDRGVGGERVRTEPAGDGDPIDAAASVRAAAARGADRVEERDLRRSVETTPVAATVVFVVDASASMRPAMAAAKGVVLEYLGESYRRRDEVAFVAVAGESAEVLLPPTRGVSLAARHLKELPTGDRTPLPDGLETAAGVLERAETGPGVAIVVTDGRANVAEGSPTAATREAARRLAGTGASVVVVDAGDSRAGVAELVAAETGGEVIPLETLSPEFVRTAADDAAGALESDSDGG